VAHAFKWARRLGRAFRRMQDSNARALGKIAAAGAIERGARCDDQLAVDGLGWDQDPWRLGAPGCEVNLATGRVEPPNPAHGITRQALVAPRTMPTPVWDQFLWDSTGGDPAMIQFLQAWSGYCLTGDVSEEKFVFLYGPGGNGKGTYLYTLTAIMHDYAARTPVELFMTRKHDVHPEHIARLTGVRAVVASEIQAGQTFNVVRLKDFTGRDGKLSGEFKYGHVFEFMAQFKVLFVGNDQPRLPGVDDAIKRRLVLLPFLHKPAVADATLKDRLRDEYPGILQWMIEGENLRRATPGGLAALVPATAASATTAYLEEQDVFKAWADERCKFGPGEQMKVGDGFEDYRGWCSLNDCQPEVGERQFSRKFLAAFPRVRFVRTAQARILEGVSLLPTSC
jgi:putative DNA primase/helicase